jgi:hypothetical protein
MKKKFEFFFGIFDWLILFYFILFVSGQREEFWRIQFWVESKTNLWMETNVGWLLTFS